jgi:guanylate kinase
VSHRIASELKKLQEYRARIGDENQKYIQAHPELRSLVDDFVAAVIAHKPDDLIKFGAFFFSDLRKNGLLGPCPVVIAGPSGVGKGTLINKLLTDFPEFFGFSVSHTTRGPRPGEENGVHYNFVTKGDFEIAVEKGDFIEYAKVHTSYYGTSLQAVEKVSIVLSRVMKFLYPFLHFTTNVSVFRQLLLSSISTGTSTSLQVRSVGKVCILDIDIQGVQSVKRSTLDCKYLFIQPPSLLELENRLRGRGTETAEKIKIRLENAVGELDYGAEPGNFDAIVVNVDLDSSYQQLVSILQGWYPDLDLTLPSKA